MNIEDEIESLRGECEALTTMVGSMLLLLQPDLAAQVVRQLEEYTEQMHANALADPNASDRKIDRCARMIGAFLDALRDRAAGQGMQG